MGLKTERKDVPFFPLHCSRSRWLLKSHRPDKFNCKIPLGFSFSLQIQHVADHKGRKVMLRFPLHSIGSASGEGDFAWFLFGAKLQWQQHLCWCFSSCQTHTTITAPVQCVSRTTHQVSLLWRRCQTANTISRRHRAEDPSWRLLCWAHFLNIGRQTMAFGSPAVSPVLSRDI